MPFINHHIFRQFCFDIVIDLGQLNYKLFYVILVNNQQVTKKSISVYSILSNNSCLHH